MDNYKDLILGIFSRTLKDSILISKEETIENGVKISDFTIKFKHINEEDDMAYEKIKQLFFKIEEDLIKEWREQSEKQLQCSRK